MGSKNQKLNLDKDELYDLYVNKQLTSNEIADIYNCSTKSVRNYLAKYGIEIRPNGEAVKLQRSKWSPEKELNRSRKFSNTWANKTEDELAAIQAKKMLSGNINSPTAILKAHQTRIANGTSNTSKSENEFYHKLILLGFAEDDIIRNYIDKVRYPFNCDFYIKSKDLFIEYQGHQSHGPAPFDENNEDHIKLLIKYQDAGYDMSTWFKRDPHKLEVAEENNINLLRIYPKHTNYLLKDGIITTIDINDIYKI